MQESYTLVCTLGVTGTANKKPSTGLGFLDQCRAELSWLAPHPTPFAKG
jgi:hypothetical protein